MNSVELLNRLTRHLSVADVGTLSARVKQEIAGEITAGLMEFFENIPDVWSRSTFSFRVPAARQLQCDVTNGSPVISNIPFLAEEKGRSIKFDGAPDEWNEVIDTNMVLDTYPGESGTDTATIYPDAITLQDIVLKKIVSDPRIHNDGCTLTRDDRIKHHGDYRRFWNSSGFRKFGKPTRYGVEYGGQSQNSDVVVILRLDPIPTEEIVIRFDADYYPNPISMFDMSTPVKIPVTDGHANLILIPLIESRLIGCSVWNGTKKAEDKINELAAVARLEMTKITTDFARSRNTIGTKRGY